jgi:hypothetical protein
MNAPFLKGGQGGSLYKSPEKLLQNLLVVILNEVKALELIEKFRFFASL